MTGPSATAAPVLSDQGERDAAVAERSRNVLIDAGAGTGKTTILVQRLVSMLAGDNAGSAVPIDRIAVVTFTRRAAGELRLRIRERLLQELPKSGTAQQTRLHQALSGLDTAYIGTIHGFADRLLRLRPAEAHLSPSYEVVDDDEPLARETFDALLGAVETGTMADLLAGSTAAGRAVEATEILLTALSCGLRPESQELEYYTRFGLDALIAGFIRHRDTPPPDRAPVEADLSSFRRYAQEFIGLASAASGDSVGSRWIQSATELLRELLSEDNPAALYRSLMGRHLRGPADDTKKVGFAGDEQAYRVWKAFDRDDTKKALRVGSLRDDMLSPLHRWMATSLVRLFPVVVECYERVKAKHKALDQVDLLLKLRDLLAGDLAVRRYYQRLFDHVFVDEFQDTDPLQAEILLYLCEREPRAQRWRDIEVAQGKLTLVGDPKQSIYRFRRADVAMYDQVRQLVESTGSLNTRLSVNFRSRASVITWVNDRFSGLLGLPRERGQLFDPRTGEVFQQDLESCRRDQDGAPGVQVVPFSRDDDQKADPYRELEAETLANYLRWLVQVRKLPVKDRETDTDQPVHFGDIAILAVTTTTLPPLFSELDRLGIPYAARGGSLFLQDHLHRQFLLGLRAIADADDGVAEAALLRPPYFAIDLLDLVLSRQPAEGSTSVEIQRAQAARDFVRDLRRKRFSRPPGATARDLLEQTAFGRTVALGPNGAQRLEHLRELCLVLEQMAATEGLDYDAVTARMRDWIASPIQLDPPRPVGEAAVQIMSVHQAKGLEFPVVVLWDCRCPLKGQDQNVPWRVAPTGWTMSLDGLSWEEPDGLHLKESEKLYQNAERKRVVYVAATRARDLLVLPKAEGSKPGQHIWATLLHGLSFPFVEQMQPYVAGAGAPWAKEVPSPAAIVPTPTCFEVDVQSRWSQAATAAAQPLFRPVAVAAEGTMARLEPVDETAPRPRRTSRYGPVFGETVHRAIGRVLRHPATAPSDAVQIDIRYTGLDKQVDEAIADVQRTIDALRKEGLPITIGANLQLEYPLAAADDGELLVGYADLVCALPDRLDVVDFKTDSPPSAAIEGVYPEYVRQVRAYAKAISSSATSTGRIVRCGLLFTANGLFTWLSP